jgi:hypothetical protein
LAATLQIGGVRCVGDIQDRFFLIEWDKELETIIREELALNRAVVYLTFNAFNLRYERGSDVVVIEDHSKRTARRKCVFRIS